MFSLHKDLNFLISFRKKYKDYESDLKKFERLYFGFEQLISDIESSGEIPEEARRILAQRYLKAMSLPEIAKKKKISRQAVNNMIRRYIGKIIRPSHTINLSVKDISDNLEAFEQVCSELEYDCAMAYAMQKKRVHDIAKSMHKSDQDIYNKLLRATGKLRLIKYLGGNL